jgi:hypothetical protein
VEWEFPLFLVWNIDILVISISLSKMNEQEFRAKVLTDFGASRSEIKELLDYNQNIFDRSSLKFPLQFPLVLVLIGLTGSYIF